jgi:hypothetical protein
MKNLLQHIKEKLQVSNAKTSVPFDDFKDTPKSVKEITDKALSKLNNNEYDLVNVYGDDLPTLWRSLNFEDKDTKVRSLTSNGREFTIEFSTHYGLNNAKSYEEAYSRQLSELNVLVKILGKGDINKGWCVLEYISEDIY